MNNKQPGLIPTSLQRVRCFLNTQGQMKVKPWADVDETLDGFFNMLVTHHKNEPFWQGLEELLFELSTDMKRRIEAKEGEVIDNEVLNPMRHHQLLDEIRRAVAGHQKGRGGFRKLASMLSAPAIGVLLLLGGVASLGCSNVEPADGTSEYAQADSGTDNSRDTGDKDTTDTDTGQSTDKEEDTDVDTDEDTEDTSRDSTLEEIVADTVPNQRKQQEVLDCIDALHDSWRTGLEGLFNSEDDNQILYHLECLMGEIGPDDPLCLNPEQAGEYDLDTLLNNCAVLVYMGVRFE